MAIVIIKSSLKKLPCHLLTTWYKLAEIHNLCCECKMVTVVKLLLQDKTWTDKFLSTRCQQRLTKILYGLKRSSLTVDGRERVWEVQGPEFSAWKIGAGINLDTAANFFYCILFEHHNFITEEIKINSRQSFITCSKWLQSLHKTPGSWPIYTTYSFQCAAHELVLLICGAMLMMTSKCVFSQ